MPTYSITAPNGKTLDVTGDHVPTESELKDIFLKAGVESDPKQQASAPDRRGDSGGIITMGAAAALPAAANLAAEFATNPNVPKMAAAGGRFIGAVAPAVAGGYEYGPTGAIAGLAAAAKGAWAGGKTGWFTGKLAQNIAAPVASIMEKAVPYASALSALFGVQGVGDLAQMAEPKRGDIGIAGIGAPGRADVQASMMGAQIKALVSQGMAPAEASRTVSNAWAKFLSEQK